MNPWLLNLPLPRCIAAEPHVRPASIALSPSLATKVQAAPDRDEAGDPITALACSPNVSGTDSSCVSIPMYLTRSPFSSSIVSPSMTLLTLCIGPA